MIGSDILNKLFKILSLLISVLLIFTFVGCDVSKSEDSSVSKNNGSQAVRVESDDSPLIMSSDRVMNKYFDISVFDEENYADIYLGKKFKIDCTYADDVFEVPTTINKMNELGWWLCKGNSYDENSLVFSYETIETLLVNEKGTMITAWFYNSSKTSKKLGECNIVKFLINNDFYSEVENHETFNLNGITDSMAITDIIEKLGTPSHFYEVSEELYYLDYFITKKDRRNGITIYVNPVNDCIVSFEISYYE